MDEPYEVGSTLVVPGSKFEQAVAWVRARITPELRQTAVEAHLAYYRNAFPLLRENFMLQLQVDHYTDKNAWNALSALAPDLIRVPRGRKGRNDLARRAGILFSILDVAMVFSLDPTRNGGERTMATQDAAYCNAEGASACDAVGLAVKGENAKYKTIETIWTERPAFFQLPR